MQEVGPCSTRLWWWKSHAAMPRIWDFVNWFDHIQPYCCDGGGSHCPNVWLGCAEYLLPTLTKFCIPLSPQKPKTEQKKKQKQNGTKKKEIKNKQDYISITPNLTKLSFSWILSFHSSFFYCYNCEIYSRTCSSGICRCFWLFRIDYLLYLTCILDFFLPLLLKSSCAILLYSNSSIYFLIAFQKNCSQIKVFLQVEPLSFMMPEEKYKRKRNDLLLYFSFFPFELGQITTILINSSLK